MEPRPSNAGAAADSTQLNNSHPVQASSAPAEGMPGGFAVTAGSILNTVSIAAVHVIIYFDLTDRSRHLEVCSLGSLPDKHVLISLHLNPLWEHEGTSLTPK